MSLLVWPALCTGQFVTRGRVLASLGKSHSCETPTTSSINPSAAAISVAAGTSETIRLTNDYFSDSLSSVLCPLSSVLCPLSSALCPPNFLLPNFYFLILLSSMPSVVFLRAVNVGGTNRCQPALIAKQLAKFGIVNIGAVGTFVVRENVSESTLRAAIAKKLPFKCEIMICPA